MRKSKDPTEARPQLRRRRRRSRRRSEPSEVTVSHGGKKAKERPERGEASRGAAG